eukprot:218164-Alexandrium_andersonii.AAC.1
MCTCGGAAKRTAVKSLAPPMSPGIRRHARPLAPASSAWSGRRRGRRGWAGPVCYAACVRALGHAAA